MFPSAVFLSRHGVCPSPLVLLSVLVLLTTSCNAARLIKLVAYWPCEGEKTTKAGC